MYKEAFNLLFFSLGFLIAVLVMIQNAFIKREAIDTLPLGFIFWYDQRGNASLSPYLQERHPCWSNFLAVHPAGFGFRELVFYH
jgi:hypothetical protein